MNINIDEFGDITVGELIASHVPEDRICKVRARVEEELCVRIVAVILRTNLAEIIEKEGGEVLKASLPGPMASLLGGSAMPAISLRMADAIKKQLLSNGREILIPLIEEELKELEKEPVRNIIDLWNTQD